MAQKWSSPRMLKSTELALIVFYQNLLRLCRLNVPGTWSGADHISPWNILMYILSHSSDFIIESRFRIWEIWKASRELWHGTESALSFREFRSNDLKSGCAVVPNLPLLSVRLISQEVIIAQSWMMNPKTVLKSVLSSCSEISSAFCKLQLLQFHFALIVMSKAKYAFSVNQGTILLWKIWIDWQGILKLRYLGNEKR